MKILIAVLLAAAGIVAEGRDLEKELWFFADFDRPAQIAGGEFPMEPAAAGYCEGRFGRGYYFHSPTRNDLPPMKAFFADRERFQLSEGATLAPSGDGAKFSGGTLYVKPRHFALRNATPWVTTTTGYTCSMYVKGRKGDELTLRVRLTPLTDEEQAKIKKRLKKGSNWKTFEESPLVADCSSNEVVRLTGEWQRVYAYAKFDNRAAVTGRDVGFAVKASGPVEMNRIQFQQTGDYPKCGNYVPTVWTEGGTETKVSPLYTADRIYTETFPAKEGSFSAWVKCFENDAPKMHGLDVWGLSRPWKQDWGFNGYYMMTGEKAHNPACDWPLRLPYEWTHYAASWKDGRVTVWTNGVPAKVKEKVAFQPMNGPETVIFRCGGAADGGGVGDALLDEVAIFKTALTDDEVRKLAAGKGPLVGASKTVLATPVSFLTFFRNQTNAALRAATWSAEAGTYAVKGTVGGEPLSGTVEIAKGRGRLLIPFDPARFRPGWYDWSFSLVDAKGKSVLDRAGKLEVKGRLARDQFKVMSWGGNERCHMEYYPLVGVNMVNCNGEADMRATTAAGLFANLRYENSKRFAAMDYDEGATRDEAARDLARYEGLHTWATTLVNSEIYGGEVMNQATNHPSFLARAARELGFEPDWRWYGGWAPGLKWKDIGGDFPRGVLGRLPAFETLRWFMREGMPWYRADLAVREAVHAICPDNVVWTEPIVDCGMADFVDMMADWIYEYDENVTLSQVRHMYSGVRAAKKPFMPTVAFNYWPEQKGFNPKLPGCREQTDLAQGCDEVMIKSWMAIGAVPAESFSIFNAPAWEYGASNYLAWVAKPEAGVKTIAEPDASARYGRFMEETFKPAAELLRSLPNETAPVAVAFTVEGPWAGRFALYWYARDLLRNLCQIGSAFDVLADNDLTAERLSQYRYVIFPMARVITPEHDRAVRAAAAKGTIFVFDSFKAKSLEYPNSVQIPMKTDPRMDPKTMKIPLRDWYTNRLDEVVARQSAWSDHDFESAGTTSYTFSKAYKGAKYVTVVNNLRRSGGSVLTEFKTNAWYRPCGAPQRITTHFNLPKGWVVYEFNGGDVGAHDAAKPLTLDYGAAQGRLFVALPKPLDDIDVEVKADGAASAVATVTVSDDDGRPAPGRLLVAVTVSDPSGRVHDETGRYPVENGRATVPIRFARDDEPGTLFKPWRIRVKDLTSGLEGSETFRR